MVAKRRRWGILAAVIGSLAFTCAWSLGGNQAVAQSATCGGEPATMIGTEGDDRLVGTDGRDVILALGGRDTIDALGGDDVICPGFDDEAEENDSDFLSLGDGDDSAYPSGGGDEIDGGGGSDFILGGPGDDRLTGGLGNDYLEARAGDDTLSDRDGDDYLDGGEDDDELTLENSGPRAYMDGGPGNDVLSGDAEYLAAGEGDDELRGAAETQYLDAGPGNDVLRSGGGEDYLDGGDGNDEQHGSGGAEYLDGGVGRDRLLGRGGEDGLDGGPGDDVLGGGPGADSFFAGDGNDVLHARDEITDRIFDCGDGHDYVIADEPHDTGVERIRCHAPGDPPDTDVDNPGVRLDSDGDALLDSWETAGYDDDGDGDIDVDLPTLGADPNRADIFLALAWLEDTGVFTSHSHEPRQEALDRIIQAFEDAPFENPQGPPGIDLHIVKLGAVPETDDNRVLGHFANGCDYVWDDFDAAKDEVLPQRQRTIFHFGLIAHEARNCRDERIGGRSRNHQNSDARFTEGASDFFTSQWDWGAFGGSAPSDQQIAGTIMHELGHNLGLGHGGVRQDASDTWVADHVNYRPNHLSVMNYSFQNKGLYTRIGERMEFGGLDYSRFSHVDLPTLDEASLDERAGLAGSEATAGYGSVFYCDGGGRNILAQGAVDWDCDGDASEPAVGADINGDAGTEHTSANEWAHLRFDGGSIGAAGAVFEPPETTATTLSDEQTLEEEVSRRVATTVTAEPVISVSGLRLELRAQLNAPGGGPLAGRTLRFGGPAGGEPYCSAVTDANGVARCGVPQSLAVIQAIVSGGYRVRFEGDDAYAPSDADGALFGP